MSPFFIASDVEKSVQFYCSKLGFDLRYSQPKEHPFFAIVGRDHAQLILKDPRESASEAAQPHPNPSRYDWAPWDAFVFVPDPDGLAADFQARGLSVPDGVHDRSDGLRGFEVRDPDGYVLFFGRPATSISSPRA